MSSVFRATSPGDEAGIAALLDRVFAGERDRSFLTPALLNWKYWEPRDDFAGARSYVMEKNGEIVAHGALWPVTVRTERGCERGLQVVDWASDPRAPGAGVSLLQRITRMYDFVYSIGGTEATQTVMPKFGFRAVGAAITFARPLRPLRQMLLHQTKDARLPVRLLRNAWWAVAPHPPRIAGWDVNEISDDRLTTSIPRAAERDAGFLRYLRRCPTARFRVFEMLRDGRPVGWFALAEAAGQARIAGVLLADPSAQHWRAAFTLAQRAALRHTDATELIARSTSPEAAQAAPETGMRVRARTPVLLFRKVDPNVVPPLTFQLWDDDSAFYGSECPGFAT